MSLPELLLRDKRLLAVLTELRALYSGIDPTRCHPSLYEHGFSHIGRVIGNAVLIAGEDAIDQDALTLIIAGALCHDLGYLSQVEPHVTESVRRAPPILQRSGFSADDITVVTSTILAHSSSGRIPETISEKVLYVADKCDLLGSDGTVRQMLHQARRFPERDTLCNSLLSESAFLYHKLLDMRIGSKFVQARWEETRSLLLSVLARRLELDPRIRN